MKIIIFSILLSAINFGVKASTFDLVDSISERNLKCELNVKKAKQIYNLQEQFEKLNDQLLSAEEDIEIINTLLGKLDPIKFSNLASTTNARMKNGRIIIENLAGKAYDYERKAGKLPECEKVKNLIAQDKKYIDTFRQDLTALIIKLNDVIHGAEKEEKNIESTQFRSNGYKKHTYQNKDFELYITNPLRLEIFLKGKSGLYGSLSNLEKSLPQGQHLGFATNGGIFAIGGLAKGLYIENFTEVVGVDRNNDPSNEGNFYLQPNGIFLVDSWHKAFVMTTDNYVEKYIQGKAKNALPKLATQSGPMLLISGKINPNFTPSSKNNNIRVGVGILPAGDVVFIKSITPVNFHLFASLFKGLGCYNALYLDGGPNTVLYAEGQRKSNFDNYMGPIIGIINKRAEFLKLNQ